MTNFFGKAGSGDTRGPGPSGRSWLFLWGLLLLGVTPLHGQRTIADYDYENLSFRGFSLEGGHIWPTRADPTYTVGARVDLGYLGPGLRIVPGVSFWSSTMNASEVRKLEGNVDDLVEDQFGPGVDYSGVDLGTIDWSDFVVSLDGHFVWSVPYGFLTYAGAGMALHVMDGDGDVIAGTFVEDLLDSVKPGFNLHGGLEYPLSEGFRLYGMGKYEMMEDLGYLELRAGLQIMLSEPAPGEERRP